MLRVGFYWELAPAPLLGCVLQTQLAYCVLLVNLKGMQSVELHFHWYFPVIKKMRLHLHLRNVASEA